MRFDFGTWLLIGLAAALVLLAVWRSDGSHVAGWRSTWQALTDFLPLLLAIFVIIGFADVLLPRELIASWLGGGTGIRGVMIGTAVGAVTPGGPFVSFPLAATLYQAGAGIGPMVAFIVSWGLLSVSRLPMELAIVGPRLTFARMASSLILPPIAGVIAMLLFERAG
ncbi:MAG: permease [Anaerolineales bacterium]|nr:permease [Anaerolineales bacterium]